MSTSVFGSWRKGNSRSPFGHRFKTHLSSGWFKYKMPYSCPIHALFMPYSCPIHALFNYFLYLYLLYIYIVAGRFILIQPISRILQISFKWLGQQWWHFVKRQSLVGGSVRLFGSCRLPEIPKYPHCARRFCEHLEISEVLIAPIIIRLFLLYVWCSHDLYLWSFEGTSNAWAEEGPCLPSFWPIAPSKGHRRSVVPGESDPGTGFSEPQKSLAENLYHRDL